MPEGEDSMADGFVTYLSLFFWIRAGVSRWTAWPGPMAVVEIGRTGVWQQEAMTCFSAGLGDIIPWPDPQPRPH